VTFDAARSVGVGAAAAAVARRSASREARGTMNRRWGDVSLMPSSSARQVMRSSLAVGKLARRSRVRAMPRIGDLGDGTPRMG
jgi:hypothetical protein